MVESAHGACLIHEHPDSVEADHLGKGKRAAGALKPGGGEPPQPQALVHAQGAERLLVFTDLAQA